MVSGLELYTLMILVYFIVVETDVVICVCVCVYFLLLFVIFFSLLGHASCITVVS